MPGSTASGCAGSVPWRSCRGPRSSPGSGEEGARLHARARGEETDPFRPGAPRSAWPSPCRSSRRSRSSSRSGSCSTDWSAALAGQLTGRGLAADRAVLTLELDLAFAPPGTSPRIEVEQRFPEPTADAEAVERLLFARLEREPPPAAVQRLDLELRGTTPAAGQQLPLFVPQAARTARLGWQLARLALTYGEDRVRRVAITDPEAPLPEDRWTWRRSGLEATRRVAGVTRLLREHPRIDVELDADGRLDGHPLERPARGGRGLQSMAGRGGVVARPDRARLRQGRRGSAGWPSSTRTASPGRGTSSACTTERRPHRCRPIRPRCVSWKPGALQPVAERPVHPDMGDEDGPGQHDPADPGPAPMPRTASPRAQLWTRL